MRLNKFKAFLFDMDGVIIDSNSEIEDFWKRWLQNEKNKYTEADIHQYIHGCKTRATIDHLFKHSSEETKTEILHSAIAFDFEMQPQMIKGLPEFLKAITSITNNIALVTSASKQRAQKMLALHSIEKPFH